MPGKYMWLLGGVVIGFVAHGWLMKLPGVSKLPQF